MAALSSSEALLLHHEFHLDTRVEGCGGVGRGHAEVGFMRCESRIQKLAVVTDLPYPAGCTKIYAVLAANNPSITVTHFARQRHVLLLTICTEIELASMNENEATYNCIPDQYPSPSPPDKHSAFIFLCLQVHTAGWCLHDIGIYYIPV